MRESNEQKNSEYGHFLHRAISVEKKWIYYLQKKDLKEIGMKMPTPYDGEIILSIRFVLIFTNNWAMCFFNLNNL